MRVYSIEETDYSSITCFLKKIACKAKELLETLEEDEEEVYYRKKKEEDPDDWGVKRGKSRY